MKVAFLGLGAMGRGMAGQLIKAGHSVVGYDVAPAALDALEAMGGVRATTGAQACEGAEALIVMVVNATQTEAALFGETGAAGALPQGALVLSSVTMPREDAERIAAAAADQGWLYLDAPVSGGAAGAENGGLTFMAAGDDRAFAAAEPLMAVMGKNVFRLGDHAGPGSTMKMVHQLAAGCNLAVVAEVMSLAAHMGLDGAKVLDVLSVSAGGSWMAGDRGPRMLTEGEDPKSAVDIFVKDLGIVLDAARAERFPVPVSAAALQVFLGASMAGFGRHDDSQATRFYESLGGEPVRKVGDGG